jgi:hypothetical protein
MKAITVEAGEGERQVKSVAGRRQGLKVHMHEIL